MEVTCQHPRGPPPRLGWLEGWGAGDATKIPEMLGGLCQLLPLKDVHQNRLDPLQMGLQLWGNRAPGARLPSRSLDQPSNGTESKWH